VRTVASNDKEKRTSELSMRRPRRRPVVNHSVSASKVAQTAATNTLVYETSPTAAMVPARINIGAAGTGTPSCVISTLMNTAQAHSAGGIAVGKCHTIPLLRKTIADGWTFGLSRQPARDSLNRCDSAFAAPDKASRQWPRAIPRAASNTGF
jgi:hypothetical protein